MLQIGCGAIGDLKKGGYTKKGGGFAITDAIERRRGADHVLRSGMYEENTELSHSLALGGPLVGLDR